MNNPNKKRLRRTMMFLNAQKPGLIKDPYIYKADSLMLDLEDAVAENQKDAARFSLYHALKTIDYGDTDMRAEMEGGHRGSYNEEDSLGSMGYQKQEFDEDSEELINVDDEADEAEDFSFDGDGLDDSYDE